MGILVSLIFRSLSILLMIWGFCIAFTPHKALSQSNKTDVIETAQVKNSNSLLFDKNTNELINQIRAASRHFRHIEEAEKAGYRPFGPDMPNMGQHWINTRMALAPDIELNKPSTLTYLKVNGEAIITGVAYTTSIQPGERPPDLPSPEMKWHYHSGNLEDEAHGIHRSHGNHEQKDLAKLAMVHAWVWTENPAGIFSADNWSLSYLRHGLIPPSNINAPASKALFLASGQIDYYLKFIELCLKNDTFDKADIRKILMVYSGKIESFVSNIPETRMVLKPEQERIENIWQNMWKAIKAELGPVLWDKVVKFI